MQIRNTTTKLLALAIGLGALTTIWMTWGANRVDAAMFDAKTTGMFGVTRGQTARTNVVNLGGSDVLIECLYFDGMGNIVARSGRLRVPPGQATLFDADATSFVGIGGRGELRAVVMAIRNPNTRLLNFTSEVFDNDTFKTTLFVPSDSFEDCACGGPIPDNQ